MKETVKVLRECAWVATGAACVTLVAAQNHGGFLLFFVVIALLIWAIYNLVSYWRKPEHRKIFVTKSAIWVLAIVLVGANHWYLANASRRDGDLLAAKILEFKSQHGNYPKDMAEAGVIDPSFGRRWMMGYGFSEGEPYLIYAATFTMFDSYSYDFDSKQWVFHPD